jgi:hypothetical protein
MMKRILLLVGTALLSGQLLADPIIPPSDIPSPQVLPILEFVFAIEDGGYASFGLAPVNNFAPLDFATALYLAQPIPSVEASVGGNGLEQILIMNLYSFNGYWITNGSSDNLFDPSPLSRAGGDTPQIIAHYITNALNEAETAPRIQAPEMNATGATGALTLLAGVLFVLLGPRPVNLVA